jgi:hypothetical protein
MIGRQGQPLRLHGCDDRPWARHDTTTRDAHSVKRRDATLIRHTLCIQTSVASHSRSLDHYNDAVAANPYTRPALSAIAHSLGAIALAPYILAHSVVHDEELLASHLAIALSDPISFLTSSITFLCSRHLFL